MKAVVLLFDTLTRNHISSYGGEAITPNFTRLANHSVQYNRFHVGSMPCMPARRELHTGRYNFLHRSWGPLEPFDFSVPQALSKNGIHSHLVTDHKHYWRDGGATYHTRYSTFDFIRGQEGDCWKGHVEKPEVNYSGLEGEAVIARRKKRIAQDFINRDYMKSEQDHTLTRTIESGLEFIETNKDQDNWFMQLECFDPHEPFFVPEKYLNMYGCTQSDFNGWINYNCGIDSPEQKRLTKLFYRALMTMCDDYLGKVLDTFDKHDLWEDTLLMVCTDHGFLLGEHDWWGKNIMPVYNEIANTPFYLWDPRYKVKNEKNNALAQTIDIPATLLDFFGIEKPTSMHGKSISPSLLTHENVRDYALFGYYGAHINITDGEYVYMRTPREKQNSLNEYTVMPMHIDSLFSVDSLSKSSLSDGFSFTQGAKLLKIPTSINYTNAYRFGNKLYNIVNDPNQNSPINNVELELKYSRKIKELMESEESPEEVFPYYGLDSLSYDSIESERNEYDKYLNSKFSHLNLKQQNVAEGLELILKSHDDKEYITSFIDNYAAQTDILSEQDTINIANQIFTGDTLKSVLYRLTLELRFS
ncbi:MAG: sulfatase [Vibrio sp.]